MGEREELREEEDGRRKEEMKGWGERGVKGRRGWKKEGRNERMGEREELREEEDGRRKEEMKGWGEEELREEEDGRR